MDSSEPNNNDHLYEEIPVNKQMQLMKRMS